MVSNPSELHVRPWEDAGYQLRVSAFDRAVAAVLSLLVVVGLCVLALVIIWWTGRSRGTQAAVPVRLQNIGTGGAPLGDDLQVDTDNPGQEEELEDPVLQDSLASVSDIVAAKLADLDNPLIADPNSTQRGGPKGDPVRGGGGTGGSGTPRRWELMFDKGNTLDTYARQLDFFQIELGVLLPGNQVRYVSQLSSPAPVVRDGPAEAEKRFYLTWQQGELQEADRQLLAKAGVDAGRRIILKFLPPDLEAKLAALERAHAGAKADQILRTRFGIRPQGNGYAFFVLEQTYR